MLSIIILPVAFQVALDLAVNVPEDLALCPLRLSCKLIPYVPRDVRTQGIFQNLQYRFSLYLVR
jgi:hypothetical protein